LLWEFGEGERERERERREKYLNQNSMKLNELLDEQR